MTSRLRVPCLSTISLSRLHVRSPKFSIQRNPLPPLHRYSTNTLNASVLVQLLASAIPAPVGWLNATSSALRIFRIGQP